MLMTFLHSTNLTLADGKQKKAFHPLFQRRKANKLYAVPLQFMPCGMHLTDHEIIHDPPKITVGLRLHLLHVQRATPRRVQTFFTTALHQPAAL